MIRVRLFLLLRYCVIDAASPSVHGELCPIDGADVAAEPAGNCLIQQQFTRISQTIAARKVLHGLALTSQNSAKIASDPDANAIAAIDNPTLPGHGRVHHSIFELSFAQLDRNVFWFVFACMLAFTIFVDQAENFAAQRAERAPTERKFLERVNAELMMFGCVGLFLFVLKNVQDLPEEDNILIEFVDILCSMGACGLIAIAAVLFVMRSINDRNWKGLEMVNLLDTSIEPTGSVERSSLVVSMVNPKTMKAMDYQVMAKTFVRKQQLPDDFLYSDYLNFTMCQNACDLMAVQWYTWLVLLTGVLGLFLLRVVHGTHYPNIVYVTAFGVSNWLILVCWIAMLCRVNHKHSELIRSIREDQQELQSAGVKMGQCAAKISEISENKHHKHDGSAEDEWAGGVASRMKFTMQLVALLNSFLGSFYLLHVQFNLQAAGYHWSWRPCLILPLAIGLFILLPIIVTRFTLSEAYFMPDGDALDATQQALTQLEEDFAYIRRMWEAKGRPAFPPELEVDQAGLAKVLRDLGMHAIGRARLFRVFWALDADLSGTVTTEELMGRLENNIHQIDQSHTTSTGFALFSGVATATTSLAGFRSKHLGEKEEQGEK